VTLADLTTLRVGGPVGRLTDAESPAELVAALPEEPMASSGEVVLLGAGSNTVPSDAAVAHVIRPRWSTIDIHPDDAATHLVEVGAGASWDGLAQRAVAEGWSGFEALVGIPGTVGAAPVQNIGAYGHEVSELIEHVTVWDRFAKCTAHLTPPELGFGYRTSRIKNPTRFSGARPRPREQPAPDSAPDPRPRPAPDSAPDPRPRPTPDLAPDPTHLPDPASGQVPTPTAEGQSRWLPRFVVLSVAFRVRLSAWSAPVLYPELAGALDIELGERATLSETAQAVLALRRSKGMVLDDADHNTWSTGSYFSNPILTASQAAALPADAPRFDAGRNPAGELLVKTSAAWLIAHAGVAKGWGLNRRATTSTAHVLALTNRGGATASDIRELGDAIAGKVLDAYGIALTPEPTLLP
jgi:UDP-N-acetylmuramate dehydrogenase